MDCPLLLIAFSQTPSPSVIITPSPLPLEPSQHIARCGSRSSPVRATNPSDLEAPGAVGHENGSDVGQRKEGCLVPSDAIRIRKWWREPLGCSHCFFNRVHVAHPNFAPEGQGGGRPTMIVHRLAIPPVSSPCLVKDLSNLFPSPRTWKEFPDA